jgi:hypothetical protein
MAISLDSRPRRFTVEPPAIAQKKLRHEISGIHPFDFNPVESSQVRSVHIISITAQNCRNGSIVRGRPATERVEKAIERDGGIAETTVA